MFNVTVYKCYVYVCVSVNDIVCNVKVSFMSDKSVIASVIVDGVMIEILYLPKVRWKFIEERDW